MNGWSRGWMLAIPVACAAAMYARFFGGYWLGDDFGNLHEAWFAAQRGTTLAQAWSQLFAPVPSEGAFYRPAMIAALLANAALAGARYPGWFVVGYAIHLANVALVALLVAELARASGRDGRAAGIVAAAAFALCPLLAEGVFWISARADAAVTLFTLAGLLAWSRAGASVARAFVLPLCMVAALGFKESAAVLPLQLALVVAGWPTRPTRGQIVAVVACFALAALFFVVRAHLFGDVWQVYRATDSAPSADRLRLALASIAPWWQALSQQTPGVASGYVALLAAATATLLLATRGAQRSLAAALFAASAGLCAATLLNLGGLNPSGEGGRLVYSPFAWLALALGVGSAATVTGRRGPPARIFGIALLAAATITGAWVLERELRLARDAQRDVQALALAAREWALTHPGLTLLVIDAQRGPVVTGRNAQGGLVLPPVQPEPLLHRIVPTLPAEIELRYDQLDAGLATRLAELRPSHVDAGVLKQLAERAGARWPDHYGCWSSRERRIVAFPAPVPARRLPWASAVRAAIAPCGMQS
jgi:hypothetical protein